MTLWSSCWLDGCPYTPTATPTTVVSRLYVVWKLGIFKSGSTFMVKQIVLYGEKMAFWHLTMNHSRRVLFNCKKENVMFCLSNPLECVDLRRKHVVNDACMVAGEHVIRQQNILIVIIDHCWRSYVCTFLLYWKKQYQLLCLVRF